MRFNYKNLQLIIITLMIGAASLLLPASLAMGQDCKKLSDGSYKVKLKLIGFKKSEFTLVITGDTYVLSGGAYLLTGDSTNLTGKILWYDRMFGLIPSLSGDALETGSSTFSLGPRCFELAHTMRKFRLTYCANLHFTQGKGTIRRVTKK